MARYILLCLFPLILYFQITFGQWAGESAACRAEHGACTKHVYENIRLTALRSSGCQKFCQCVHASTELDGSVTYMWVEQQCPPTTLFDDSLPAPVCNHAANVQCTGTYDEDCSCEHGACTQFIYENVRLVAQTSTGCKKFCQCAHASTQLDGSVTYHWVEHTCPAGTLFDSKIRVCNHAYNVQCTGSGQDNSGLNCSSTSQPSGGQVPIVSGDNECFEEYGFCTKHQYEIVRLVALKSSGCKSFCHCAYASTEIDGSVTYKWIKKTCPANTLFDETISVCNHDYDVQCQKEESEDCKSEHETCTQFIYDNVRLVAQSSSGCKKFCQCAHASTQLDGSVTYHWVEHTCPVGTLFDSKLLVCNHAYNVQCTGSGQDNLGLIGSPTSQPSGGQVPIVSGDNECFEEHGSCTKHQYENVRLVALKSSGCKNFCQCAYASTEIDGSVTYKWVKKTCPANTLFDESLPTPVCNHDYNVQCQKEESEDCKSEHGACFQFIYENVRLVAKTSSGCKRFCQCAHASTQLDGSVTYRWVEHTCPAGTLFDSKLRVCNHADNVQCTGSGQDNSGLNGSPTSQPSGGQVPIVSGDNECFEEYGFCTKHQYEIVRLVALKSSGCKSFCHCAYASTEIDGSVTYKWVKKTCPANTLFDETISICNHDYDVQCQKEESEDCKSEHETCTQFIYDNVRLVVQSSSGCKKVCQCAHASTQLDGSVTYHWVEHTCPVGTLFDSKLLVCNHAYNVQCTGSGQDNSGLNGSPTSQPSGGQVPIVSGDNECFEEYGSCTKHQYENVRLVALKSSGCKNFCQCAYASTEIDGSVTYKWVKKTCPANTLFDESLPTPVCNHDYDVQCQKEKSEDCKSEHGACFQFVYENVRLVAKTNSGCKKFCQCAHASTQLDGSVTYHWVEHTCPAGTLFDSKIRVCNHANNVQCTGLNGSPTSQPYGGQVPIVSGSGQDNSGSNGSPTSQLSGGQVPIVSGYNECFEEYGFCTKHQYEKVRLVALKSSRCKNFCQCAFASTESDGSVTYKWVKKTCPANTLFDESLSTPVCNHDYYVQCQSVVDNKDGCLNELGTCTKSEYEVKRLAALRSSGCKKFCQCAHASTEQDGSVTYYWAEHTCPKNTLFDESLPTPVCNWAYNVQC